MLRSRYEGENAFEGRAYKKNSRLLKEERGVLFAYLFGSFSTGTAIATSDVHIAVYLSPETHGMFDTQLALMQLLTQSLKRETDVVILNTAPPFLRYVVLKEGVCVLDRTPESRTVVYEMPSMPLPLEYSRGCIGRP